MTVEEAIQMALEYETKVRDVYSEAVRDAKDATGKRVFGVLAKEEQGHLDYLNSRLDEWKKTGKVTVENLDSMIPSKERIQEGVDSLKGKMSEKDRNWEIKMLEKALEVELETSGFYRKMVDQLEDDGKIMFERFMEIEEGHVAIVQAELDAVSGNGFFFDMEEFNMEMG